MDTFWLGSPFCPGFIATAVCLNEILTHSSPKSVYTGYYGVGLFSTLRWPVKLTIVIVAPLLTIGLFGFAWTSLGLQHNVHWIAPMIFSTCIAIANVSSSQDC